MKFKNYKNERLKEFQSIKNEFKTSVEGNEARLHIYGDIGESWWGDSITANDVKEFLNKTTTDVIHVHINSLGGDVFDGIAIYNQLKNHKAKIIVHIDGIAASAASVIAMAGDEIHMPKTAMMMIHNAWTFAMGNANDFRKVVTDLEKIGNALIESYIPRFVGSKEELVQLLEDETFLNSDEAIAFGLADVEVDEEEQPKEPIKNSLLSKYAASVKPTVKPTKQTIIGNFRRNNK